VPETISKPIACSAQTVHYSCEEINTITKWTKMSFHFTHVTYEVHQVRPKKISMPVVHLAQAMLLSCAEVNTVSKRTEASFHLTQVT
jgi:hypothetical protein